MRNLRLVSYSDAVFDGELPLKATAWDTNNDSVICAFGPTPNHPTIELRRKENLQPSEKIDGKFVNHRSTLINSWDAPCPLPDLDCDEIILMHYFPDTLTTCIILAGGDLVLAREEPEPGQEAIEIVGSIDVGIIAAAWAPDEELLAIVTREDNLILMSRYLEPVNEVTMTPNDLQASKHVSVGWGKKETQFQGKRAKAMRDPTMPEHIDEGKPSRFDDGSVSISWRGDSSFLAINAVIPEHRRAIRVYSREGVLDSISEPVDGLESALSWRPYGNLIASIKRSEGNTATEKVQVIFFERNGLRHGEFDLRTSTTDVTQARTKFQLNWNRDSSVLAVSSLDCVQFWTMGNHHYYLKQHYRISHEILDRPINVKWHPEKPLLCNVASNNKDASLELLSRVSTGSNIMPHDFGITAVIDGSILKLTPLKHAGVPPPFAFCEIDVASPIVDCAISNDCQIIAILTDISVELYKWVCRPLTETSIRPELRHSTEVNRLGGISLNALTETQSKRFFSQICYRGTSELYVLAPPQDNKGAFCVHLSFSREEADANPPAEALPVNASQAVVADHTQNIFCDILQRNVWAQGNNSSTQIVEESLSQTGVPPTPLRSGQPNTSVFQIFVSENLRTVYDENRFHQVSLTARGSLYVDDRLLVRDCTSFLVTEKYLVLTTAQHLLKFVHLEDPENMVVPGDAPEADERCRAIEKGARIVTVIPSTYATILQMPRGNLETIYPRVLVLSGIRESLQKLDYRTAFLACQNHQVDMNILYDYLPQLFMSNLSKVIEDLKKPSRIDEFLSKLKEEDVTTTLYQNTLEPLTVRLVQNEINGQVPTPVKVVTPGTEKVNQICDSLITILNTKPKKYLQNVITAHVCKRPPDLTAALTLVSSLKKSSTEEADLAISHLCFLTDTNRLYDAALALYDLDLTLLVAQNAQRDPREYMPFLQSLQALPTLRRQYQIDNHLRNYGKALVSLHSLGAHDEVEAFSIKHKLYTTAMELYKYDTKHLPRITILYAEHLESLSQHSAAATMYESLGDNATAYPLYALAHQWRESLTCATLIPLEQDKLIELAIRLATTCAEESRDYRSAATIYADYLQDYLTAARLFCRGSYFADAIRILSLRNLSSEIPTIIDPGLAEKFGEIIELVSDCKSQLSAQTSRIIELRIKKAEDPLAFYGGDATLAAADGIHIDIPDNISLAPTDTSTLGGQSLFTRYGTDASKFGGTIASNASRRTSKTKRREERKRARGKKGSVYEEEYLVSSVRRLIERLNGAQEEVKRLVNALLRRPSSSSSPSVNSNSNSPTPRGGGGGAAFREQAKKIDDIMTEIGDLCEKAIKEIWDVDLNASASSSDDHQRQQEKNVGGGGGGGGGGPTEEDDDVTALKKDSSSTLPELKKWDFKSGNVLILR